MSCKVVALRLPGSRYAYLWPPAGLAGALQCSRISVHGPGHVIAAEPGGEASWKPAQGAQAVGVQQHPVGNKHAAHHDRIVDALACPGCAAEVMAEACCSAAA